MDQVHSYSFDKQSRIGNDMCGVTAREVQNNATGSYNTTNYFLDSCGMDTPIGFATQQPNIFFKGGTNAPSCNIVGESKLKIGSLQTHSKCKISLQQRPFLTVPYLGRGPPRPVIESRIQQGTATDELESCKLLTEKSFNEHSVMPLIPSIRYTIQNPDNLIESSADSGWVRGGLPSRELTRNHDYSERQPSN